MHYLIGSRVQGTFLCTVCGLRKWLCGLKEAGVHTAEGMCHMPLLLANGSVFSLPEEQNIKYIVRHTSSS
jgi:hypothetical protein